ncbi:hypothetical protein BC937DRAFT_94873 [Endogone sp. FLAS-F59071]|nr:hypothetical protein BC937DRAFT_94873 [Endogone sp. FLAS-F59071]|eukprot:RUS13722.1 hypothetical protein BC937DRAFT_94873 [Endogone sp. FLAS-F59071]
MLSIFPTSSLRHCVLTRTLKQWSQIGKCTC